MEVLGSLTPFDDGESLNSRSCSKDGSLLVGGLESELDRLGELGEHVLRRVRFDGEPLQREEGKNEGEVVSDLMKK